MYEDAESLSFQNNFFDCVKMDRVLQHIKNDETVIEEIARVLKPNGKLAVLETDWLGLEFYVPDTSFGEKFNHLLVYKVLNNGDALRKLVTQLAKKGFQNISFEVFQIDIPKYDLAKVFIKIDEIIEASTNYKELVITQKEFLKWKESIRFVENNTTVIGLHH